MEWSLKYQTLAKCHPEDLWQIFSELERWQDWSDVFGCTGWIHGEPWKPGSRFFVELLYPKRIDLEVMVVKCDPPREVVLLPHGQGYAAQQWVHFARDPYGDAMIRSEEHFVGSDRFKDPLVQQQLYQMFDRWFKPLAHEAEIHCKAFAL